MTQNEKLVTYLSSGHAITQGKARKLFGIRRLSARINDLRTSGFCVYTNTRNGKTSYRMGMPSRAIVAAAYQVGGSNLFR